MPRPVSSVTRPAFQSKKTGRSVRHVLNEALEPRRMFSTYYVSPTGNNSASGTSVATPWQTVAKVNATAFQPGDTVLFQRGGVWRESLTASSDGAAGNPITYAAYGDAAAAKPLFSGSNLNDPSAFTLVSGTTYSTPATTANWFYVDAAFTREAQTAAGSTDAATDLAFVQATTNSFFFDSSAGLLYVNIGAALTGHTLETGVREDVVYNAGHSHLVFDNLSATETAHDNAGYAFRMEKGADLQWTNCDATLAGKHHFGVIDGTDVVAKNLTASYAAPDQGFGGASAFVVFADYTQAGLMNTSQWINCTWTNPNGAYPAFISHGDAVDSIGLIVLDNMVSNNEYGNGISATTTGPTERLEIRGGLFGGASVFWDGNNSLFDGVTFTGGIASLELSGSNNVVQNCLFTDLTPDIFSGHNGAVVDQGTGNVVRFNTFKYDGSPAINVFKATTDTQIYGNIFDTQWTILQYIPGTPLFTSDYNVFGTSSSEVVGNSLGTVSYTLAQWKAMGFDAHSVNADPKFVNAAAGNYNLSATSPAVDIDATVPAAGVDALVTDFSGDARPVFAGYDAGAFERQNVTEASFGVAPATATAPSGGIGSSESFVVTLSAPLGFASTVNYTTGDGTAVAGVDYTATAGTLNFPAGTVSQTVVVPLLVNPAGVEGTSVFSLTLSSPSAYTALSTATATGTINVISQTAVPFDRKTPRVYTDSAGQTVTVRLAGPGSGELVFAHGIADPTEIRLTQTSAASILNVVTAGRGVTRLGGLTVDGSLGAILAVNATIAGNVVVTGGLTRLVAGNVEAGSTITTQDAARRGTYTFANVAGLTLTSAGPVASITAGSWTAGTLTAPTIGVLRVAGSAGLNVTSTGGGIGLGTAKLGPVAGGIWSVNGLVNVISATSVVKEWAGHFPGGLKSLAVAGNFSGAITGTSINSFKVLGGVTGATVGLTATGVALNSFTVRGAIDGTAVRTAGTINNITAGSVTNSLIFAGVASTVTTLPTDRSAFVVTAAINKVTITAGAAVGFGDSAIAASKIGRVLLRNVQTANGGVAFGVAGESLASFSDFQPGVKPFLWSARQDVALLTFPDDFKVSILP